MLTMSEKENPRQIARKYRCLFSVPQVEHLPYKETIMPGIDFDVLRKEITMQQVLSLLQFRPSSRSGDQSRGPCPVHGSSSQQSRAFSVNWTEERYYCHKCHSRGNPLELWAAAQRTTFHDGAITLCNAIGREVPWIHRW